MLLKNGRRWGNRGGARRCGLLDGPEVPDAEWRAPPMASGTVETC